MRLVRTKGARRDDNRSPGPNQEAGDIPKPQAPKWSWDLTDPFLVVFTILLTVALLAHAYVGHFTRYMADDYCTAAAVHTDGLFTSQKSLPGLVGAVFLQLRDWTSRTPGPPDCSFPARSRTGPHVSCLDWTISQFGSNFIWRRPLLTSFLLAELIIFVTVSDDRGGIYEALYWQTGMLTYWVPLILMVAYVGFVKHVDESTSRVRLAALYWFLSAALTFIAGGFNETYAVFQMCGLLVAIGRPLGQALQTPPTIRWRPHRLCYGEHNRISGPG